MTTRFLPGHTEVTRIFEYRRIAKELARAYRRSIKGCARENDNETMKVLLKLLKAGAKDAIELNAQASVPESEPTVIVLAAQKHEQDDQSTQ